MNHPLEGRPGALLLPTIFSVTLMAVLGVASIAPALPHVARVFGASASEIALLITAFTLPGVFLAPVMGVLADRWGRRSVLVPALLLFGLAGTACALAPSLESLVVLRLLQGIGAAPLGSLNVTLIGDHYRGVRQVATMGRNAAVLSVGTATYPLLGGMLADADWRLPFFLPAIALPVAVLAWRALDGSEGSRATSLHDYFARVRTSLDLRMLGWMTISLLTFVILYGSYLSYLPFLMDERFGASPTRIGLLISVASITTGIVSLRLAAITRLLGIRGVLLTAFSLYAASMALIPTLDEILWLALPAALFGAGNGLNIPTVQSWLARSVDRDVRAAVMSLNATSLRLGQTIGPLVASAGYALGGIEGAFATGGVAAALLILLGLGLTRGTSD